MAVGVVSFFLSEEGWGAINSPDLPDEHEAWVFYSAIQMSGFRVLHEGDRVEFDYEAALQDGYQFRVTRVRPL